MQRKETVFVSRSLDFGSRKLAGDFAGDDELGGLFGRLALEIQRSLDYYENYFGMAAVKCLTVCPIAEDAMDLLGRLNRTLGLATNTLDIASLIACPEMPDVFTQQCCMPTMGLALRQAVRG